MDSTHASSPIGRSDRRKEDARLLTGRGQYISDIVLPNMRHVSFVRSPMAHAKILSIDSSRANLDGVVAILDGRELARHLPDEPDGPFIFPDKWKTQVRHSFLSPRRPLLASDKVRHVGEALAVVVADSKDVADDAVELISYELDPLDVVTNPEAALDNDAVLVHEKYGTNLFGQFELSKGDLASALSEAPHRLRRRIYHHRHAAAPLECRGAVASYDPRTAFVS